MFVSVRFGSLREYGTPILFGFPKRKDPKKVPLISETPISGVSGLRVEGLSATACVELRAEGSDIGVWNGIGFRVWGLGFRV